MKAGIKPMSTGSLFDNAFRMSFGKFTDVLKINLLFSLFIAVMAVIVIAIPVSLAGGWEDIFLYKFRSSFDRFRSFFIYSRFFGIVIICITVIAVIFIIVSVIYNGIINDLFLRTFIGEGWNFKSSLKKVWGKTGSIFFSLIPSLGVIIAFIICAGIVIVLMSIFLSIFGLIISIAGGVIFFLYGMIVLEMVVPVIITENLSGGRAVARAFTLGNYSILGVAWVYLLFIVMNLTVSALLGSVFKLFQYLFYNSHLVLSVATVIYAVLYIIMYLFMEAIGTALAVSIFFNQKIKYESFGVEKLIEDYVDGSGPKE